MMPKNGLRSGGLNPRPLVHESSALTIRPQLLDFYFHHNLNSKKRVIVKQSKTLNFVLFVLSFPDGQKINYFF
jgi:hypothetical protein